MALCPPAFSIWDMLYFVHWEEGTLPVNWQPIKPANAQHWRVP